MSRARHIPLLLTVSLGLAAAGCGADESPGRAAPGDEVIDESAAEEAIEVLQGNAPGVAVIVEYPDGADVDGLTEELAEAYSLRITSRYHELLLGAAFIAPDEETVATLADDPRVAGLTRDRLIERTEDDDPGMDSELDADYADAEAAGEAEAQGGSEGGAKKGHPIVRTIEPQQESTGWRLVRGSQAPGDGSGMLVAVLDSGIDYFHPDLVDNVHPTMGKDCVRRTDKTVMDLHGHGTHVAGIIAAQNNGFGTVGVAPKARVIPVRIFNAKNFTTAGSVLCGLDYVARRTERIDAVNLSIEGDCQGPCADDLPEARALRKLIKKDVFVAVCAGNFGSDANNSFLGHVDEAVTVSAYLDWNGKLSSKDRYANFSNFGDGVDIGAPGVGIMSPTVDEDGNSVYQRKNGCSMATPFVTGAAVVLKQVHGGGHERLRARIIEDARTAYPGRGGDHPERLMVFRDPFAESGCGDGVCLGDETDVTCGEDCGCGGALGCEDVAPFGCYCDPGCAAAGDCCDDVEDVCPAQ